MSIQSKAMNILRIHAVTRKMGISRATIYDWLNPKSSRYDATFPKPRRLGMQSVGWIESDLDEWLMKCPPASRNNLI